MTELAETMDQATKVMVDKEGKYLTFSLDNEEYGIGILKIKEIIGMMPITTVPQTSLIPERLKELRQKGEIRFETFHKGRNGRVIELSEL